MEINLIDLDSKECLIIVSSEFVSVCLFLAQQPNGGRAASCSRFLDHTK
jgi:hypothetical protein